jgi:hypothetical protein
MLQPTPGLNASAPPVGYVALPLPPTPPGQGNGSSSSDDCTTSVAIVQDPLPHHPDTTWTWKVSREDSDRV